jgi:hypothetical protein
VGDEGRSDEPYEDQYFACLPTTVEIGGAKFRVGVHLAMVRERLTCVGLDVRSFEELPSTSGARTRRPLNPEWVEVTSPVMRALRTSEVIEAAKVPLRGHIDRTLDGISKLSGPFPKMTATQLIRGALEGPEPKRKRGPRPLLSDGTLREVVAATYRIGGRRPVVAVREALETSGALKPPVTIDQARKAVAAARAKGFIPPADRGRPRQEDQP